MIKNNSAIEIEDQCALSYCSYTTSSLQAWFFLHFQSSWHLLYWRDTIKSKWVSPRLSKNILLATSHHVYLGRSWRLDQFEIRLQFIPVLHPIKMGSKSRVKIALCSFWLQNTHQLLVEATSQQWKSNHFRFKVNKKNWIDTSAIELGEVSLAEDLLKKCYSPFALCANKNLL